MDRDKETRDVMLVSCAVVHEACTACDRCGASVARVRWRMFVVCLGSGSSCYMAFGSSLWATQKAELYAWSSEAARKPSVFADNRGGLWGGQT